jgi:hypothetical protein
MIFDADDFVHRDLAATVESNPDHPGWVVRDGLMYSRERNSYVRQPNFNRTCGTSFIVPFEAYGVSADLSASSSQEQVAEAFGERLSAIMGAHRDAETWHRQHGRILERFPYRAAVYHVDTGENHSGKTLLGVARPYDGRLRRDFGIRRSRGRLSTLWSAVGPTAIIYDGGRLATRIGRRLAKFGPSAT